LRDGQSARAVTRTAIRITAHLSNHIAQRQLRAGYQALLAGARDGAFDVVVAEALDRLSRDQYVASPFKRMTFGGIRIFTLSEGDVSELHVGLKGTMNALFLKDLAAKTRWGLPGRVEAGKSAGINSYGYKVVRQVSVDGTVITGDREIKAGEATVIKRIFVITPTACRPGASLSS
jgi:site-specific DNA recombinase